MKTSVIVRITGALAVAAFMVGCEPDRMGYVDLAAEEVCDEARRCDNLGSNGLHSDYDECIINERHSFNSMWPADDCGEGRINGDKFDTCMTRAKLWACEGGLGDWLSTAEHCAASRVCVD